MPDRTERHSNRARPALQALSEADPAIAALALWCNHRDGPATRTRGDTITYGPDFAALSRHEQQGLAAHHILHVALRHSARLTDLQTRLGADFQPRLYSLASDALINEALLAADYALPRPAVRATELIAQALGTQITPQQALADWSADRLYFALTGEGSGGEDTQAQAQRYAKNQSFSQDLDPEDSGTESDDTETAARWRQHMTRALAAGRAAGRGIGIMGHRLADIPEQQTPWETLLRRLLTQAVLHQSRPSPQRPSRRWIAATAEAMQAGTASPGFEPGTHRTTEIPRIAVGLDASGSIDNARLALFWAEVIGISRRLRAEVHVLIFDDTIRDHITLKPHDPPPKLPEMPRDGGTGFLAVVKEAQRLQATALVMLTDLEGDAGPPPRGLRVIWAVPEGQGLQPPFGTLIDLSR